MVRLGDLFDFKNGRSFKKTEWKESGLPIIRIQNLNKEAAPFNYYQDEYDNAIEVNYGDLLFSWSGTVGSSFGPHIWRREKALLNQHIFKLTFKTEMLVDYAYYSLLFITAEIEKNVVGAVGLVHVTKKSLNEYEIPALPIPEQQRIVAILDQAFADIEKARANAEKNLKNARELFDSYLQQVFSQRGEGWVENSLENVVEENCSLSYGVVQPGDDFINGLPVVRPTDLKSKIIYVEGLKLIDPLLAKGYERTTLEGGELLLCVRGSTGVVSIADAELAGANVTRGIVPIRFDQSVMLQAFGYYQFISHDIQRQIKSHTYGAALMQINIRDLRKLTVVLPPLQFQSEAINQLDDATRKMRRLEFVYQAKLKSLDELKKSLLQKAFSGELTKSKGIAA